MKTDSARRPPRILALCLGVVACACSRDPQIALRYELASTLEPALVLRVETRVDVAPGDPREFTADLPYRSVDIGVGYEVRDFDGKGARSLFITHDSALGYDFGARFAFTLLPPVGAAPPLSIRARALGARLNEVFAQSPAVGATFGAGNEVTIALADLRCGAAAACAGDSSCCEGACSNTKRDPMNCGACGSVCGASGDTCASGGCKCNGGSPCVAGQSCCPGRGCIDTASDAFNCGACGNVCAPGEACKSGVCTCGTVTCGAAQACCDNVCTDGGCVCGATTCSSTTPICCGSDCVDPSSDGVHCGTCGNGCKAPFLCSAGACTCAGGVCSPGDTCCETGCASLATDALNCGACGRACGTGESCIGGVCQCGTGPRCAATEICCGNVGSTPSCVDRNSHDTCGSCDNKCSATDSCINEQCRCAGTTQTCGAAHCCAGVGCFDIATNPARCGSCTNVCPGTSCVAGMCSGPPSGCPAGCPPYQTCVGMSCVCPGATPVCSAPTPDCCGAGTGCVNLQVDRSNCGACGNSCSGTDLCCNGTCVAQGPDNCGTCGKCPSTRTCKDCPGGWTCVGGQWGSCLVNN